MMRYLTVFISLLLATALFGSGAVPGKGVEYKSSLGSGFHPRSSAKDALLDQNHAIFELHFTSQNPIYDDLGTDEYRTIQPVTSPVELACNGVIQNFLLDSAAMRMLSVMPGKYKFYIALGQGYEEVISDSVEILPGHRTIVDVHFALEEQRLQIISFKPVLYFYPEKDLNVQVDLTPKGQFTFTYPQYDNGWNGVAHPDGSMTIGGKTYPYLFWEGTNPGTFASDYSTGFVVKQEEVITFLEEKLTKMGLNDREQADFITFWGPRMMNAPQGHAQFLFNKEYDDVAELSVLPKPEEIFRVYLLWTPLENGILLQPEAQELPKMSRQGFHVVEWGGSELPALQVLSYKQ